MDQPRPDMPSAYEQATTDSVNMPMAVVGAALGAAFGGLVWFAIEYYAHYQIGFIAILCGAAAGWGAVTLGKGHGFPVGVIAAAFGLLGVVGGSYGSFVAQKAQAQDELRSEAANYPGFEEMEPEAQEAALALGRAAIDEIGYVEYMKEDTKSLMWMLLFGGIGMAYGFKLGASGMGGDEQPVAAAYTDDEDEDA